MLSTRQGRHIPLPQCSTVLREALLQVLSSLAYVTLWVLVTRDGVDHSLSPPLWNRVLGVDKLLPKCPEWAEGDPDVQVAGVRKGNVLPLAAAEHVLCILEWRSVIVSFAFAFNCTGV